MERGEKLITFLDTHILMWLYDALYDRFTSVAEKAIDEGDLYISPMVVLELAYLKEVNRLKPTPHKVITTLGNTINLKRSSVDFNMLIETAIQIKWTRDPFDRIITAEATLHDATLVSADRMIKKHYVKTVW